MICTIILLNGHNRLHFYQFVVRNFINILTVNTILSACNERIYWEVVSITWSSPTVCVGSLYWTNANITNRNNGFLSNVIHIDYNIWLTYVIKARWHILTYVGYRPTHKACVCVCATFTCGRDESVLECVGVLKIKNKRNADAQNRCAA